MLELNPRNIIVEHRGKYRQICFWYCKMKIFLTLLNYLKLSLLFSKFWIFSDIFENYYYYKQLQNKLNRTNLSSFKNSLYFIKYLRFFSIWVNILNFYFISILIFFYLNWFLVNLLKILSYLRKSYFLL